MTSSKTGPRPVPAPTGAAQRPANAYARFIPREELADFAAWQPDTFAGLGAATTPTGAPIKPAPAQAAEPDAPPPPPEPTPEELAAEWALRVQEARSQGRQEGYRDGLEALEAAKRQYAQQVTAQVVQVVAAFEEQMAGLESRMADAVLHTAVTLARQIVRSEITQRPACMAQVAQEAVAAVMLSAKHLRLRLHPDDLSLVEQGAGDALKARAVILQADQSLSRGGCVVESDLGQVDARIESRWARAAAVFDVDLAWDSPADTTPLEAPQNELECAAAVEETVDDPDGEPLDGLVEAADTDAPGEEQP
ncbi:FliH/SctL family protein [Ideonella sp.]|uniref:FliH/SctL family protein n=1 Tax=Ideonella sp. TaxID=1929293 RepID=UPI003BB62332